MGHSAAVGAGQLGSTLLKAQQEMMLRPRLGLDVEGPGTGLSLGEKNSATFLPGAGYSAPGVINQMEGVGRPKARIYCI